MSERTGPAFVCIGAQKGGTTWLYENLSKHPEVWMPPVKEIHYFNRLCVNEQLLGDWTVPHEHGVKRYIGEIKKLNIKNIRWMRNYYEYSMNASQYLALFSNKYTDGSISGDITPAYSTLEEKGIKYASRILDKNVPIIFIIRNPIYRSWSALKMILRYQDRRIEDVSTAEIVSMLQQPNIALGSEYIKTITSWRKYFNNFHVLTFDELCESPRALLTRVSEIIGISDNWDERIIKKRVWADNKNISMSPTVLEALTQTYTKEINSLDKIIDFDCAKHWLKDTDG
ncbi:hypothetical protein MNBD_GAMMA06-600 [hydrothermal vent metagenome]|uniref:Sulfotransferase n=1 Tax=hydrothermal vent metagenome TaxID=652676 RepID=A0A3B0WQ83_9ZZZZ